MGVVELSILWSLVVDEHHEHVGEEHAVFAFDLDASSEILSQAVREAFSCVIVVLLVFFLHSGMMSLLQSFTLSTVNCGCEAKMFTMVLTWFGSFLQAIVSKPCFLKCVLSLAHGLSRSSPVLNLWASSVNVPLVRFRWVVAAFALLDCI